MITREDYMDHKATHREYYGQFITPTIVAQVARMIGKDRIMASTDPHFNDIPLREWDAFSGSAWGLTAKMKEAGDYLTLSAYVCVAKEAACRIKEGV
jgi:hypothetical protein